MKRLIGILFNRRLPPDPPVPREQAPRYDLIDPAGRNQHFHVQDWEQLTDHAVDPARFPLAPDHLCRRHFAEHERLTAAYQLARCLERAYAVQVDDDCLEDCLRCRAERRLVDRIRGPDDYARDLARRQDAYWRSDEFKREVARAMDEHPYPGP